MKKENIQIAGRESYVITADEGKVFRRVRDGVLFGECVTLGYTYYLNGKSLEYPLWELPEHYVEVDAQDEVAIGGM